MLVIYLFFRCHHVSEGCANCRTQFCYRCLCTAEVNVTERGSRGITASCAHIFVTINMRFISSMII